MLIDPEDIVARKLGLQHPPGTCPLNNIFLLDRSGRVVLRHHLSAIKDDAFRQAWRTLVR
ncbi:MAG: hypothetical protein HY748_11545 [Elusimicrobia bacterium]|nr:hypothetical protein [Elusimicrobiota bacterium]